MHRWDVINYFIKKHNYHSYLEIGYYKGWSFDNVQAPFKIAVDPNPSKDPGQEATPINHVIIEAPHAIFKCTSDDFFYEACNRPEMGLDTMQWDIIFIDGLHEASQVRKDIDNALKKLAPGGTILLHDMNPPTYEHTTTGDHAGNWNGDCYKALLSYGPDFPFNFYTVDTDWGVSVIQPLDEEVSAMHWGDVDYAEAQENWGYFYRFRSALLNLVSVQQFLKMEQYATA